VQGHLSWLEAIVIGLIQGVSELFPVSSLGHSVLLPAVIGGSWARDLDVSAGESPYLAFIVGLHVATAIALVIYFWRDWVRVIRGLVTSIVRREVADPDQRLAWLLILGTIPVGLAGLLLEHTFRAVLAKPVPTAVFLVLNGVVLLAGEHLRRRVTAPDPAAVAPPGRQVGVDAPTKVLRPRAGVASEAPTEAMYLTAADDRSVLSPGVAPGEPGADYVDERVSGAESDARLARMPTGRVVLIGAAQIAALAPGISRSGITMVTGLVRGLSHEDAARFSFLLSTPVILAAGVLKLGDLAGPLGDGIRAQVLVGSLLSGIGAYLSVRFLTRWFATNSLRPFGIYCIVAGAGALAWFALR